MRISKIQNKKRTSTPLLFRGDKSILTVTIVLSLFGLLMIYSASSTIAYIQHQDSFYYFKRQILWLIIGYVFAFTLYKINLQKLNKALSYSIVFIGISLMIFMLPEALSPFLPDGTKVIDMPLVITLNGATRWYDFGFISVQPVEILKLGLIVFGAFWLSREEKEKIKLSNFINQFKYNENLYIILKLVLESQFTIFTLISCILALTQRDLDTTIILFLIYIIISFINSKDKRSKLLNVVIILFAIFAFLILMLAEPYRRNRFLGFIEILFRGEPSREFREGFSFQSWNGLIAIGTGGIFGVGYGESRQKLFFLQEASFTDSIFAVIGEEFGILGTILVVLLFAYLLSKTIEIAKKTKDKFYLNLALGSIFFISFQAFFNIASNLAIIPFAGMSLPFFSYGGSGTIVVLCAIGLILNVSKQAM